MLEVLLEPHEAPQRAARHLLLNVLPKKRNWRFRYFEGGHPLPNEDSFAAARAALAMLKKAKKDTLIFFLISGGGSAMFDLPLDPADHPRRHAGVSPGAAGLGRADRRDQHAAQALLRGQGRTAGDGRAGCDEGVAAAAGRAAADPGCAVFRAHFARPLDGGRCARHPREVRPEREASRAGAAVFRARRHAGVAGKQEAGGRRSCRRLPAAVLARRIALAATMNGRGRSVSRFGLRDSALEPRPGGECAGHRGEGGLLRGRGQQLRRLGLCRCGALSAGAVSHAARRAPAAVPDFSGRGDGDHEPHARRGRPEPAVCAGLRARSGEVIRESR